MAVVHVTTDTFDAEVLKSEKPVLVDFWASWCSPCMLLSPVVEEVAEERDDLLVCKVNADEQPELCIQFGVQSIPALFILKNGEIIDKSVGYRDKSNLLDWIDSVI